MISSKLFTSHKLALRGFGRRGLASLSPVPTSLSPRERAPTAIRPSANEIEAASLDARNLEKAVRHVHQDGLVVIEDVVPHQQLDHLNTRMVQDARKLQALGDKGPFNHNQGNLQQDAPPVAEFFHPSVFANPIATQITSAVMGSRPKWTFCSANSAMPPVQGSSPQRRPVHSDADFSHPNHPFALVVNVPLVTMTPANGSTEVWLGTHTTDASSQEGRHGERASGRIKEDILRQRTLTSPPVQPVVKKGSLVIRDLRLWHAGMPNTTAEVRIMLAMIHFAPWYRNPMKLRFSDDIKPQLVELERQGVLGLQVPVDWIDHEEVVPVGTCHRI
ncbi:hypothetical protein G7046_g2909 [Stylonectria norvegica]|nr:hypothetical protein G7046_g2909 [Stylonectria norvegica]